MEQAELGGVMDRFLDLHMYITSALKTFKIYLIENISSLFLRETCCFKEDSRHFAFTLNSTYFLGISK